MILSPELHFFFFCHAAIAKKKKGKKSNNIPHTLPWNLLLQHCDLSEALLLLVSGFVMVVRLAISTHTKAAKGTWRSVNGEGEMKAVPPGWFCWLLFAPLIRPLCLHTCVFLSVCVHRLPSSSPVRGPLTAATFRHLPALLSHCRPPLFPLL